MNTLAQSQDLFISNAKVINPSSPHHLKKVDLLIQNGRISKIGKKLKEPFGSVNIQGDNLIVSAGFVDLHTNVQDPGYEYKEDIKSALNAAAAGGFTGILSCSTTEPCIDGKSGIEYQKEKSKGHVVDLWPTGSISKKQEGKELAEMYDMHQAGAVAFYDFKSDIRDSQLLRLALLYTKPFDGVIMIHPSEHYLSSGGEVNEGVMSTRNGLKGMPSIAEEIGIARVLTLSEYTDHPVHFTCISTKEGVELIKKAKKKGVKVTCGVSVANLLFNEESLNNFDSNFKVNPPIRDEKTRKTLVAALKSGIIDVVVSDHWPQNIESKDCEFEVADFGMNTLESSFAMLRTATYGSIEIEDLVQILSSNTRRVINQDEIKIAEKEMANLVVFQADKKFELERSDTRSQSKNIPEMPHLKGKIIGVVNKNTYYINS